MTTLAPATVVPAPLRKGGQETRERLLGTTLALLWRGSYGSVSVDDICREAGVKKGSFYHFFSSKSELTVAAISAYALSSKVVMDSVFSPTKRPLERLRDFCEMSVQKQREKLDEIGHVCGCPLATLGSELCGVEESVRQASAELGSSMLAYFESAVADAVRVGEIEACEPKSKAEELYTVLIGTVTQARIRNDIKCVTRLWPMMQRIVGIAPIVV